jgi:hypothetical protein
MRAARVATIFYFLVCSLVLPAGVVNAVLSEIQIRTCIEQPAGYRTAPFQQGTKTYFTSPRLLAWSSLLRLVFAFGVFLLLASGVVMLLLRRAAKLPAP